MTIFLYRDSQPRPKEHFHWDNVYHNPKTPYQYESFYPGGGPPGVLFMVFTDLPSLESEQPLYFYIDGYTFDFNSLQVTLFRKSGGGWRGSSSSPEDDCDTIRALFDAFRSFPEGWEREVTLSLGRPEKRAGLEPGATEGSEGENHEHPDR